MSTPNRASVNAPSDNNDLQSRLDNVLLSDIGLETLLGRLKQSITTSRDLSAYLKERCLLEEKHGNGLKRLARTTMEIARRPDGRHGTYAKGLEEMSYVNDRMAENGLLFANNLHQMSEELRDLADNAERGRKHWKHQALDAEKRVQDAEIAMTRVKDKYYNVAEQYERAKTGERQSGKFGLKGKGGASHEEVLREKVDTLDQEYNSKVDVAHSQKQELLMKQRPEAARALADIIAECDAAVSSNFQKFAMLSEKQIVSNGVTVCPLKSDATSGGPAPRSLREIAQDVNNQKDFNDYVLSFSDEAPPMSPIKYERHHTLSQDMSADRQSYGADDPYMSGGYRNSGTSGQISGVAPYDQSSSYQNDPYTQQKQPAPQLPAISGGDNFRESFDANRQPAAAAAPVSAAAASAAPKSVAPTQSVPPTATGTGRGAPPAGRGGPPAAGRGGPPPAGRGAPPAVGRGGPPPAGRGTAAPPGTGAAPAGTTTSPTGTGRGAPPTGMGRGQPPAGRGTPPVGRGAPPPGGVPRATGAPPAVAAGAGRGLPSQQNGASGPKPTAPGAITSPAPAKPTLPPLKPVFGVSLDELFRRDGTAVPTIVYQCIQAVDLFGLQTEGIYRTSGSQPLVAQLKSQFDHDSNKVDLRTKAAFQQDINAVATLLKQFFRDLPDPLLTNANYSSFIQAAKIGDDTMRRDQLHQIINSLPDPNYATLRVLVLHMNRVATNSQQNRMTASNLAIVFGPTLMGNHSGGPGADVRDSSWQAKVIETILVNTLQIFDDDD